MSTPLSDFAKDTLLEVMNIGAGNAATALSQLTGTRVDITTPRMDVLKVEQVPGFVGKPDAIVSVVLVQVLGDAPGVMMLMFPKESALKIAHLLIRQSHTMLTEIDRTALCEVGNVLAGSYLTSLSKFLKLNFIQSVPNAAMDMAGALLGGILGNIGKESEDVLASEVNFSIKDIGVDGRIFFLFDPPSSQRILKAADQYIA